MTKIVCNKCNKDIIIDGKTAIFMGKIIEPASQINSTGVMTRGMREIELHLCGDCIKPIMSEILKYDRPKETKTKVSSKT